MNQAMVSVSMLVPLILLLLFVPLSVTVHPGPEQGELTDGLSKLRDWNQVNESQIKKWWYEKQASDRNFPRVFPWCFNTGSGYKLPDDVAQFKPSFDKTLTWRAYDPDRDSWKAYHDNSAGRGWVKDIKAYRLEIKRSVPNYNIFGGVEGKDPEFEQQWAVIEIELDFVKHLYVQSIGGPLGVPVGDINIDFSCKADSPDFYNVAKVVPCHFAPKSAYRWPNVFVIHSLAQGRSKIRFRFRWTEAHCHETSMFQFLIIATNDFIQNDYVLSPIFQFEQLDSASAVPHPYHPYHDEVKCNSSGPNSLKSIVDKRFSRIIPNMEYDDCVLNGKAGKADNEDRDLCPPGRFHCTPKWTKKDEWKSQGKQWYSDLVEAPIQKCCEVDFPLPTTPTTTTPTTTSTTTPTTTSTATPTTTSTTTPSTTSTSSTTPSTTSTSSTTPSTTSTSSTTPSTTSTSSTTPSTTSTSSTTPSTTSTTTTKPSTSTTKPSSTSTIIPTSNATSTAAPPITTDVPVPTISTTTQSPQQKQKIIQEKYLQYRTDRIEFQNQITHGDYCVLAFLILIPLADLSARHFKDFANIRRLGLGYWIVAHITLHSGAQLLAWWSYGLVIGGGGERPKGQVLQHYIAGILAALFHNVQLFTGLKRTATEPTYFNWTLWHSVFGYTSHVLGYLSVVLSSAGQARIWLSTALFVIWLAALIAFYFVEKRQERVLEVWFHRVHCPVLQRLVMEEENESPPMGKVKIGILVLMLLAQVILFICILHFESAEKEALRKIRIAHMLALQEQGNASKSS